MGFDNFEERVIQLNNSSEREVIDRFLKRNSLLLDKDVEYTVAIFERNRIVATGSFAGNVLKCIVVDPQYEELGLASRITSHLINEEYQRGRTHLFIYTKPENLEKFKDMGFYKIAEVPSKVVLLENNPNGIENFIENLRKYKSERDVISSIVMNCNPFTKGHKYLIEKAAEASDVLHIFVVWEDKSIFPAEVRYKLVNEGVKNLPNVVVHRGENYIISNATFPTYFIKNYCNLVKTQCMLDLNIFGTYIAPSLNINRRFVGEEPYCEVTRTYNEIMKKMLPSFGVEVVEIPRLSIDGVAVSASKVREYIREGNLKMVKNMVPQTTYDFLVSEDAETIIKKLQV